MLYLFSNFFVETAKGRFGYWIMLIKTSSDCELWDFCRQAQVMVVGYMYVCVCVQLGVIEGLRGSSCR